MEYGDHQEECRRFFATGIDGVSSDQPDHARAAAGFYGAPRFLGAFADLPVRSFDAPRNAPGPR